MKKFLCTTLAILFLVWQGSAQAALSLVLTKGTAGAIPVALLPFSDTTGASQNVSTIINNDLKNSGRFNLSTGPSQSDPSQVDLNYWRKQNIDDVIVGRVENSGFGSYKVTFSLISVFQGQGAPSSSNVLVNKTFTVSEGQLRQTAHRISDLIYQQLTGVPGVFSTKLAYVLVEKSGKHSSKYNLMVADEDGYNPRMLLSSSQPIMSPDWSPDGRQLAYVSFENGKAQIFIQDLATGSRRIISSYSGINGAPSFSKDGRQLALTLTLNGNPNIYVMNLDTKQLRQITNSFAIDTEPSWAPDGQSLIFTSTRGGKPQIYRATLSSGSVSRLTYNGVYNASASFTPDGKTMVMLHLVLHLGQGVYNVASQDLATGVVNILDSGDDQSPSVAPNGSMVIFSTHLGGREQLGMVSVDGKVKLMIPSGDGNVQEPAWSPYLG